jgi:predicted nucleic acid-binding protein
VERALADTSALLALAVSREQHHERAIEVLSRFRGAGGRFVSTPLVLTEFHNLMIARQGAAAARRVLAALLADEAYSWKDLAFEAVLRAHVEWIERFSDQDFSLTDAVSFELMRREGIERAFSFDQHFVSAGFSLLD